MKYRCQHPHTGEILFGRLVYVSPKELDDAEVAEHLAYCWNDLYLGNVNRDLSLDRTALVEAYNLLEEECKRRGLSPSYTLPRKYRVPLDQIEGVAQQDISDEEQVRQRLIRALEGLSKVDSSAEERPE